ncbi:MAG TPA: prolyl oligopeptidase family serine peptidase [Vicinamibacterales bacterium]|nr:prolyl oligopeptidase family serine peptidase [Vicinamibacterales bacterium]
MRRTVLLVGLVFAAAVLLRVAPSAQSVTTAYLSPPKVVADIMDAEPLPAVVLSPDRRTMLLSHRHSMPSIAEVSAPFYRLGGSRINPRTNGPRILNGTTSLTLKDVASGAERKLLLPPADSYSGTFSPDSRKIAVTYTTSNSIKLVVADVATGTASPVLNGGINGLGGGCNWLDDSSGFLCTLIPDGRGAPPAEPTVPTGPAIQENDGRMAPTATYEDLLKNPHDEALYEYFYTSQIAWVDLTGRKTPIDTPAIYTEPQISKDGSWLLVSRVTHPFSYVVPASQFPRDVEIWDKTGKLAKTIANVPMADTFPRNGVFPGPRAFRWHPIEPATLIYTEALDKGDPAVKAPFRDRIVAIKAPFTAPPTEWFKTEWRAAGVTFSEKGSILLTETDRDSRMRRSWLYLDGMASAPQKIWELRQQDRYRDPGSPMPRPSTGTFMEVGGAVYMTGLGASPKGDRPFLDRLNLRTLKPERIWQCDDTSYETVVALLDDNATRIITRRETKTDPPNYFIRDLAAKTLKPVTTFSDPHPQLAGVTSQFVTYTRNDGVQLNGTVYLPPGYRPGTRLPMFIWAYPAEFTSADEAGQISGNENHFLQIGGASQLLLLTQGYAVFDNPTMPIVGPGETANDHYIEQLVASAEAAINKAVDMGVADRDRVGVGGHSYGAFMTANLLAHSRLFRAGIARSGAYNRTLTPFGFQNERRNFWEIPDVYGRMSPFFFANQVKDPILLIHGEMDDNSGTFPIQSERFYMALKGFGATVRYVTLPYEAHGYAAAESNKHVMAEMITWLDRYVKNATAR